MRVVANVAITKWFRLTELASARTQPNVACSWASHNARKGRWRPIQAPLISMHHKMKNKGALQHAQHSTAQHSTAQHSTTQHSTAQHSTPALPALHSTALHCPAQLKGTNVASGAIGALVQQRFCPCRRQLSSPRVQGSRYVSVLVQVRLRTRASLWLRIYVTRVNLPSRSSGAAMSATEGSVARRLHVDVVFGACGCVG